MGSSGVGHRFIHRACIAFMSLALVLIQAAAHAETTPEAPMPPENAVTASPPPPDPLPDETAPPPVPPAPIATDAAEPDLPLQPPTEERGRPVGATRILAIVAIVAAAIAGIYVYGVIRRGL
ncbi:MAG: hypothetical protein M3164_01050 [Actinomycetota bacterium]|nr:hypothetical protein [Actinomycetota bacterium]